MKKNNVKNVDVIWFKRYGNWNFRDENLPQLNTKPLAVIKLDGDEFVWQHHDIMNLIKAYHEVDKESIRMIKLGQSGTVQKAETPLLEKLKDFIRELEQEDKGIKAHPFVKNQTALR